MPRLTLIASLVLISNIAAADDSLDELFYAPFEDSPDATLARGQAVAGKAVVNEYEAGPLPNLGKAAHSKSKYNGIYWDGRGNIDLDRGTIAFWYKPNFDIGVSANRKLAGVRTDLEGYWGEVLSFRQHQESLYLQLFDMSPQRFTNDYPDNQINQLHMQTTPPGLSFGKIVGRWQKGQWVHLACVWDRNQGIKIYENGKLADSNWGKYTWDWNYDPRILHLGGSIYSHDDFSADELHVYGQCLTDAQIAQLAKGEKPTGEPLPMTPAAETRERDLSRMGWTDADLAAIDRVKPDEPIQMTFAQVAKLEDAKRLVAQPFEGFKTTVWPLQKYGASSGGKRLEITLRPEQSYDRVRVFAQAPTRAKLSTADNKPLATIDAPRPYFRAKLEGMQNATQLTFDREAGRIGQLDLFRVERTKSLPTVTDTYVTSQKLYHVPDTTAGRAVMNDTSLRFTNAVRARTEVPATFEASSKGFGGLQILTSVLPEKAAYDGIVVHLVTRPLTRPTPVQIVVKEPIWPQRDWLVADAILEPPAAGATVATTTYSFVLRGRPVVTPVYSTPAVPGRGGLIRQDPMELAVLITAGDDVTWMLGTGGTRLAPIPADLDKVLPIAIADQIEFCREAFAETMEGHIWDIESFEAWGRLAYPLLYLWGIAPNDRIVMQLATRVYWRKGDLPFENEPKNDTGAPDWAFWQMRALEANEKIVHWMIDHRQLPNGEYGGVWGDDTDLVENWVDFVLMGDDSHKIRDSLRLIYAGLWRENLKDGLSSTIQDALHSYEEGMGTIANQLVIDYGNPTAIEHTMRACAHYDMLMKKNADDGSYSFKGYYWGAPGVWEHGDFGRDDGVNGLAFVPAAYLIWYNHHPAPQPYIKGWKRNLEHHGGIVTDTVYELLEDEAKREEMRKGWYTTETQRVIDESRYCQYANALIDEVGMKEEWKKGAYSMGSRYFLEIPPTSSYSNHMTEHHWLCYRGTGDIKYVTDSFIKSCKLINNLDWTYTVAMPSTDRIPLPHSSLSRARLGAFAVNRAGNGHFWPRHGLSWTRGSDQVAGLVDVNGYTELSTRLWSFAPAEHDLQLRVWRLWPGSYTITLHKDPDNDGRGDEVIWQKTETLQRGSYLDLKLPPKQGLVLHLKAADAKRMTFDKPDPAIGFDDVARDPKTGKLRVTVHNVGTKPVEKLVVRMKAGEKVVAEQTVDRLDAPLDLQPRTKVLEFDSAPAGAVVELANTGDDLNPFNNLVTAP